MVRADIVDVGDTLLRQVSQITFKVASIRCHGVVRKASLDRQVIEIDVDLILQLHWNVDVYWGHELSKGRIDWARRLTALRH